MHIGNIQIDIVSGGKLRLDGGAMFGPVPKVLWQKAAQADESNRIQMDTNLLLLQADGKRILVDTGLGVDLTDKERAQCAYEPPNAVQSLSALGIEPAGIDIVLFTHLHWDHAAGATRKCRSGIPSATESEYIPTFPNATYFVQRQEYEDALVDFGTGKGGYRHHHFVPLKEAGRLELLEGEAEIVPGVRVEVTGGHTRGHQVVLLESNGERGIYFADIMPTTAHLKPAWNMAYDLYPLDTAKVKLDYAKRAADENWLCFWDHDPVVKVGRIVRDSERKLAVCQASREGEAPAEPP